MWTLGPYRGPDLRMRFGWVGRLCVTAAVSGTAARAKRLPAPALLDGPAGAGAARSSHRAMTQLPVLFTRSVQRSADLVPKAAEPDANEDHDRQDEGHRRSDLKTETHPTRHGHRVPKIVLIRSRRTAEFPLASWPDRGAEQPIPCRD